MPSGADPGYWVIYSGEARQALIALTEKCKAATVAA
jgi:hypothetical protein